MLSSKLARMLTYLFVGVVTGRYMTYVNGKAVLKDWYKATRALSMIFLILNYLRGTTNG
jgi:sulfite exporter TauE/SafE